ncbi:MAG: hypothetical protein PHI37_01975 [Candidatus Gracilibacteria bacterium]|nr:hypothetical protein [Candidatus Gracilibacteria bacterium]
MNIIFGIISSFLDSITESYRKKAINNARLPDGLIAFFGPLIGLFVIYFLVILFGINYNIFYDTNTILLLFGCALIESFGSLLEVKIVKNTKISKIMPYSSLDKLFVILLGFLFFYGNPGYTSFLTLLISIFTIFLIILFSIDFKNLSIEKNIKLYIFLKFIYACNILIIGKILFEYSTLDIFALIIFFYIMFNIIINLLLKKDFTLIFKQSKIFYKYRFLTAIFGRLSFIIGIYIIESSGVLIASLLSFITIVFSVFSMKFILGDSPTPKQISLSILVIIMIGIGYYFK